MDADKKLSNKVLKIIIADSVSLTVGIIIIIIGLTKDNRAVYIAGFIFSISSTFLVGFFMPFYLRNLKLLIPVSIKIFFLIALIFYYYDNLVLTFISVVVGVVAEIALHIFKLFKRKKKKSDS